MNSSHPINCPTECHILCKALWVPGIVECQGSGWRRRLCDVEGARTGRGSPSTPEHGLNLSQTSTGLQGAPEPQPRNVKWQREAGKAAKARPRAKHLSATDTASQDGNSRPSLQSFNGAPTNPPRKGSAGSGQTQQGHRRQPVPLDAAPGLTASVGKTR